MLLENMGSSIVKFGIWFAIALIVAQESLFAGEMVTELHTKVVC